MTANLASFAHAETLTATYTATKGLVAGSGTLARTGGLQLSNGTAAGQADGLYTADTGLEGGSVDAYPLLAGLQNLYGEQLEFTAIKVLRIEADLTNTDVLVFGGGSWPGPLGDPSFTLELGPGDTLHLETTSANGWPVLSGADVLQLACASDALYKLTLVGVSSALSIPAAALHPEIIGTPRVGSEVDCTAGDWSGNPTFAYQWFRGNTAIAGATSVSYTPIAGDLAKALTRRTTASNIAGGVSIQTAPVQVQAALVADGVLDFSQAGNPLTAAL